MRHASGDIEFQGVDGSLGKLGFATKLITALRATEALHLRLPPLRDEGLTYDTLRAAFRLDDGVMAIREFALEAPALALLARKGSVDFRVSTVDVLVDIYLLESVTSLLDGIPVVSGVLDVFKDKASINAHFTGPLDDPDVAVGFLGSEGGVVDAAAGVAGQVLEGILGEDPK